MQNRERMFFGVSDMTAWKFVGINTLNFLYLMIDKKPLYGREIQSLIYELFDNIWAPGNDLTYKVLNTYEKEGYVKSTWSGNDGDKNKRYIRKYVITDAGINYLQTEQFPFVDTLRVMRKIFASSLNLIWENKFPQPEAKCSKLISSTAFTEINVLYYINSVCPDDTHKYVYAREIQQSIKQMYKNCWAPSDGVLYPLLSSLDTKGYLKSKWADDDKKRSIRLYTLTAEGFEYYKYLVQSSGMKNKIIQLDKLCDKSIVFFAQDVVKSFKRVNQSCI